jgi:GPH family glycoside/pentoside/hexuronide:cation symporter
VTTAARAPAWRLLVYGLASIPLAMAALPIYVNVPKFYADVVGLNLAAIGTLLLAARVFDAVQDPLLGYWSDLTRDTRFGRLIWLIAGAPLLALSMWGLFNPPEWSQHALMWWLVSMLLLVYTAFSMVQISYQAHGAEISSNPVERTRVVSYREGLALIGVFLAAALPQVLSQQAGERQGYAMFSLMFIPTVLILVGLTVWLSPKAESRTATVEKAALRNMSLPLRNATFRRLLMVFVFNGIAASIPATLVLFFIEDVLKAPQQAAMFLIAYFAAGAAGMALWVWLSRRIGKARAWLVGMLLSIVAFIWAFTLGAGDTTAFLVICVLSGIGLGADLALPPSMLADVIDEDEVRGLGRNEGAYFGLWNFVTKMNLALAGFASLTVLSTLGYVSKSANSPEALTALSVTYALLPCLLKAVAAILLWRYFAARPASATNPMTLSTETK